MCQAVVGLSGKKSTQKQGFSAAVFVWQCWIYRIMCQVETIENSVLEEPL